MTFLIDLAEHVLRNKIGLQNLFVTVLKFYDIIPSAYNWVRTSGSDSNTVVILHPLRNVSELRIIKAYSWKSFSAFIYGSLIFGV